MNKGELGEQRGIINPRTNVLSIEKIEIAVETVRHQLTTKLRQSGVSSNGVNQLLGGEIVTGLGDHNQIARIIKTKTIDHDETTLLRGNRTETVDKDEKIMLQRAGFTVVGAQQILFGQPVTNADDRGRLALAVAGTQLTHDPEFEW